MAYAAPSHYSNDPLFQLSLCTQRSVKYESKRNHFHSIKYIWKHRLQNGSHFVFVSMCWDISEYGCRNIWSDRSSCESLEHHWETWRLRNINRIECCHDIHSKIADMGYVMYWHERMHLRIRFRETENIHWQCHYIAYGFHAIPCYLFVL